jgi:hypothetical protein
MDVCRPPAEPNVYGNADTNNPERAVGGNILWPPPDYRATWVAAWNGMVVLGHSSGGISLLEFEQGLKTITIGNPLHEPGEPDL